MQRKEKKALRDQEVRKEKREHQEYLGHLETPARMEKMAETVQMEALD